MSKSVCGRPNCIKEIINADCIFCDDIIEGRDVDKKEKTKLKIFHFLIDKDVCSENELLELNSAIKFLLTTNCEQYDKRFAEFVVDFNEFQELVDYNTQLDIENVQRVKSNIPVTDIPDNRYIVSHKTFKQRREYE